jgi:hypothetical protein
MFDYSKTESKPITTFLWLLRFTQEVFRTVSYTYGSEFGSDTQSLKEIFYAESWEGKIFLFKLDKQIAESVYSRFYYTYYRHPSGYSICWISTVYRW